VRFLWVVLVSFVVGSASGQHGNFVTIDGSVEDLARGYLQWMKSHPDAVPGVDRLKLEMPTIDLYAPSGASIYYGADSTRNGAFLNTLPQGIRDAKTTVARPSLKEAIEMFPAFKGQEDALLSDHRYTVFAVTYPDWDKCKEQNDAIAKLRARATQSNIRVLEVRLHK
jgi:hypothetical protein